MRVFVKILSRDDISGDPLGEFYKDYPDAGIPISGNTLIRIEDGGRPLSFEIKEVYVSDTKGVQVFLQTIMYNPTAKMFDRIQAEQLSVPRNERYWVWSRSSGNPTEWLTNHGFTKY